MKVTQRNVTRNQSTADYQSGCVFVFDNRFIEADFKASAKTDLTDGMLVVRDTTTPANVKLATDATDVADVIGVLKVGCPVTVDSGETIPVNICVSGSVDSGLLVMPSGVTLKTVIDNKLLSDVLEGLGIHLENYVEHTNFDN